MDESIWEYIEERFNKLSERIYKLERNVQALEYHRLPEMERDIEYRLGSDISRLRSDIDSLRRGY